jgi:hypothetical protein
MAPSPNMPWPSERARRHRMARLGRAAWSAVRRRLRPPRRAPVGQPASLAVFVVSELPELRDLFGDRAARDTVALIRRILLGIDPAVGRIYRSTATSFAVLLPGYSVPRALAAVRRVLGETLSIESDWQGLELMLVPDFLVRTLGDPSASVDQLYEQMLAEIVGKQQSAQRRCDYLRQERESHLPSASRTRSSVADPVAGASARADQARATVAMSPAGSGSQRLRH